MNKQIANHKIHHWAALLLTVSGLAAMPLTSMAQQFVANGTALTVPSGSYSTTADRTNVVVAANSGTVTGNDNITLTTSGSSSHGVSLTGKSVANIGSALHIVTVGDNAIGIRLVEESTVEIGDNLDVRTQGNGNAYAGYVNNSRLTIGDNATLIATGTVNDSALIITNTSQVSIGKNLRLEAPASKLAALYVSGYSTLIVDTGAHIKSLNDGIQVVNQGHAVLNQATIEVEQGSAAVLGGSITSAGTLTLNDCVLTSGSAEGLIRVTFKQDGELNIVGGTLTTPNSAIYIKPETIETNVAINISGGAVINSGILLSSLNNGSVIVDIADADLSNAGGIVAGGTLGGSTTVNVSGGTGIHGDVTVSGSAAGLNLHLDHSTLTGDVTVHDDSALALSASNGTTIIGNLTANADSTIALTLTGSDTTLTGDLTGNSNSTLEVTVNDGSIITGDFTANDHSSLNLGISEDSTVIGNITGSGSSTLAVTVSEGGVLTGNLTTSEDNITTVNISDGGTITGDLTASDNSSLNLGISEDGTVIGNITGSGSSTLDITVSDSGTLAGNITTSEDNTTTVSISDGGAIIGDLTGSDNSTLAVTVGDGGALTGALNGEQVTVTVNTGGNVTINQDSDFNALANSGNVTVDTGSVVITNPITGNGTTTINDSGNLTASFDGGNGSLVINPGGGVNLNQNSNLGTISNDGTLNVGDYQVSVSDLTNDGTIAIAVNTDSGAHGTLHVTGTSSGAGTIHVTSTGDGQANPNDILGNLVTGSGVGNYTWDEVDWGLEELIVTPNPDGTISIKEDGTSPAGAVLNSAIAVQQSMWFAQQNSLLKRMGDLRYGARASRPLADKDVRVPYNSLIDNIWLRSYGQQLNIGSQVAGKAYEQLIYGVDLGTDHKFTISADSDLYLGVYAGYGRSDIDYRTPGADGEINSYYGGLYATWLHSSGFYIDATVKAASVDNNLKAPHGDTQLKANYSDVNIGGSLELGKKFTFSDAWFIEPQFQVNYLHILAEDYTAGHMNLKAQDLDALQLRIGSLFGRTINLTNSGALQPYVKISGVETISSGGTLRNGYQHTRANTDGARAELGAGLIWQLDTNNQLHLDYEASFGDKYDKPWGLTAGYRHQF